MLRSGLAALGIGIARHSTLVELRGAARHGHDMQLLMAMPQDMRGEILNSLPMSRAQLRQDLFALAEAGFKRGGYFVEFGATNGVDLSNSWLLETQFGWTGIVAEPGRKWHAALKANRNCAVEFDCVWSKSGETLTFNDFEVGEFSTIERFRAAASIRSTGSRATAIKSSR